MAASSPWWRIRGLSGTARPESWIKGPVSCLLTPKRKSNSKPLRSTRKSRSSSRTSGPGGTPRPGHRRMNSPISSGSGWARPESSSRSPPTPGPMSNRGRFTFSWEGRPRCRTPGRPSIGCMRIFPRSYQALSPFNSARGEEAIPSSWGRKHSSKKSGRQRVSPRARTEGRPGSAPKPAVQELPASTDAAPPVEVASAESTPRRQLRSTTRFPRRSISRCAPTCTRPRGTLLW